ncbi:MAG: hypothetical protein RLZZ303_2881 [Candidatus Hydrogenedentota bacterium]|jgi:uncharacterized protein (DUF697 family)/tellurite resistance protein
MENKAFEALAMISLMAAFADGGADEGERAKLKEIFDSFAELGPDAYRRVVMGEATVEAEAALLTTDELRTLAYEMALAVCDADGVSSEKEKAFLEKLRTALGLPATAVAESTRQAEAMAAAPIDMPVAPLPVELPAPGAPAADPRDAEVDALIRKYAIINGALELLPQSMATMAILPLQMRLVYLVGNAYGVQLDSGHIKEFLAVAGVGVSSQMFENFARKIFGGLVRGAMGKTAGRLAKGATGAALTFASTHALGQVAKQYYRGGRRMDQIQLKEIFSQQVTQAQQLYSQHSGTIQQQAQTLDIKQVMGMVQGRA